MRTIYPLTREWLQKKKVQWRAQQQEQATQRNRPSHDNIPLEAQAFYTDFGLLSHPATRRPSTHLTQYQRDIWNDQHKYRLVIKSQKVGLTTSALLEDFQRAITVARGKDILIIAQSQRHANEHIRTLKYLVINSQKYSKYLIINASDIAHFKEEKSKLHVCYIKNESNPAQPTRIIGLGANESGVWSWKNVQHIHMSDIAASNIKDDSGLFAAAFSRLANSGGTMLIESPPRGPRGTLYDIYVKSKLRQSHDDSVEQDSAESQFKIFEVPAREAVQARLISQSFLDAEKKRLGSLYRQYYEGQFIAAIYAAFDTYSLEQCELDGSQIGLTPIQGYSPKAMGIDPGFGSSEFALTVIEALPNLNKSRVIAAQSYERATTEQMKAVSYDLIKRLSVETIYIDAANPEFIRSIKMLIGENEKYEKIVKQATAKGHVLEDMMRVVPVNFRQYDKALLQHAKAIVEARQIAIHPQFSDLLNDLRVAQEVGGGLDKRQGNSLDLVDSFRLALNFLGAQ